MAKLRRCAPSPFTHTHTHTLYLSLPLSLSLSLSLSQVRQSKAAKQAAGRPIEDVWAAQLRQVVAEIEREVQDKADRQREGVSRVELLSVQL